MWRTTEILMVDAVENCNQDGAKVLSRATALGRYDCVVMVEADDNDAIARLSLEIGVEAGLHIETLSATSIKSPEAASQNQINTENKTADSGCERPDQWQLPGGGPENPA